MSDKPIKYTSMPTPIGYLEAGRNLMLQQQAEAQRELALPRETMRSRLRRWLRGLLTFLLLCCTASAAEIEIVRTMHDSIVLYGTQSDSPVAAFDPATPDETLIIPVGSTVVLTGSETALDVLVRGKLELRGASLACRTLTVVGLESELLVNGAPVLTFRDMPIDKVLDPSQYGHGLLVIDGKLTIKTDDWRQSWAQLTEEIHAGDTTIELTGEARGWRAGDRLVLPDTRQPTTGAELSAQTEVVTIVSTHLGTIVTVDPVQFDHLGWHKSDGTVGLLPDIACITQPIVIRSENPTGVRGHFLPTAASHVDLEGVAFVEMGRTTTAQLHSTLRDDQGNIAQIGTNQIGRYAVHAHHLLGRKANGLPWQYRVEHCSIDGSPKWGIALHGSHFGLVNDCCVYNAAGSGIVTEDPWVYGNKITNNIVIAKQPGSGQRITKGNGHDGRADADNPAGDFWHNRGGFGLTSAMNEITGNRAYCCTESYGMAGAFGGGIVLYKPNEPGVCTCKGKTDPNATIMPQMGYDGSPRRYPFVFPTNDNLAWGGWRGLETWFAHSLIGHDSGMFPGMTMVHCRKPYTYFDHQGTYTLNHRALGDFSQVATEVPQTVALDFKDDYRFREKLFEGFEARGYDAAYRYVNDSETTTFSGCTVECPTAVYYPSGPSTKFGGDLPRVMRWISTEWVGDVVFSRHRGLVKYGPKPSLTAPNPNLIGVLQTFVTPWRDGLQYQMFHPAQAEDVDPPIFGERMPIDAVERADFGFMFAKDVTPPPETCEDKLRAAEAQILELLKELDAERNN